MTRITCVSLFVGFFLGASSVGAASSPHDVLVARVQSAYGKVGDITAEFSQTHFTDLRKRTESGRLWAAKDGRVRWVYERPTRKDFVFDGDKAFFYEPEEPQVTVLEKFSQSPLSGAVTFMLGRGKIASHFCIKACADDECSLGGEQDRVLALWPRRKMPTVDHVLLVVDEKTARVRKSIVMEPLKGRRTEYEFSNVSFVGRVDPKKFKFEIPKGVPIQRATIDDAGDQPLLSCD